eukprot:m.293001 g.293001  ORF g.293001 m.293001 type:complete len:127 (+) comp40735_c0_seq11:2140-2520(+)
MCTDKAIADRFKEGHPGTAQIYDGSTCHDNIDTAESADSCPNGKEKQKETLDSERTEICMLQAKARSCLKQAEGLTYLCQNVDALNAFCSSVEDAAANLRQSAPASEEGLLLLPASRRSKKEKKSS